LLPDAAQRLQQPRPRWPDAGEKEPLAPFSLHRRKTLVLALCPARAVASIMDAAAAAPISAAGEETAPPRVPSPVCALAFAERAAVERLQARCLAGQRVTESHALAWSLGRSVCPVLRAGGQLTMQYDRATGR